MLCSYSLHQEIQLRPRHSPPPRAQAALDSPLEGREILQEPPGEQTQQKQCQRKQPQNRKKGSWLHKKILNYTKAYFPKARNLHKCIFGTNCYFVKWKRQVSLTPSDSHGILITCKLQLFLNCFFYFFQIWGSIIILLLFELKFFLRSRKNLIIVYKHIMLRGSKIIFIAAQPAWMFIKSTRQSVGPSINGTQC